MRAIIIVTLAVVSLCLCSGCATAQRGAITRAQNGIKSGDYEFSLRRLSEAQKYTTPTPEVAAEIAYLKGICYEGLHKPDEASAMFKYVSDHFSDTDYGYMAKEKLTKAGK